LGTKKEVLMDLPKENLNIMLEQLNKSKNMEGQIEKVVHHGKKYIYRCSLYYPQSVQKDV
jgi:hypothetical protein